MASGTVKWFSPKKGYGFIRMEDGQEIFVHYRAISGNGFRSLEEGDGHLRGDAGTQGTAGRQRIAQRLR